MAILEFTADAPPAPDPDDVTAAYICNDCGRALTYNGRGRKPSRCSERNNGDPECYGKRETKTGSRKAAGGDKLAEQAAAVLASMNAMVGTGALMFGMLRTASTIAGANEAFESHVFEALKMDPGLCKMILRGGASGGKLALVMAYAMFLSKVAPVAVMEFKALRAEVEGE